MSGEPLQQLSPELVLILPPEVAAIARMTLPDPGSFSSAPAATPTGRVFSLERAATLASIYAAVVAITVPPLAFMVRAVPHRPTKSGVNQHLRAERNDAH
jgi:hypothetical protein